MRASRGAILGVWFLGTCACGSFGGPASFWKGYRSELITAQQSDQGPWGGWRWIQWRADKAGTFQESAIREFAERQGWKYVSRDEYSASALAAWVSFKGTAIFPLLYPLDHGPEYWLDSERFPRHISSDSVVLKCESGWTRSDPTEESSTLVTAYGFIHLSKDGREMAVYHLWGE